MSLEEIGTCGVEAGLILVWELCLLSSFPSLPVFASGGWGVSVGSLLLQAAPSKWMVPHPSSRQWSVECVWEVDGKCFFFLLCV